MDIINIKSQSSNFLTRSETLVRFYRDVTKYRIMSQEEEREWIHLYKTGSPQEKELAKKELITSNIRFIIAAAKRFGNDSNMLDLVNEGVISLINALEMYNMEYKTRFLSFLSFYIKRDMNNYCIDHNCIVKKSNIQKTYHVLSKATNKFIQKEFRQPTPEELREILVNDYNVKINDVYDIIETKISSIDDKFDDDDDTSIGDVLLFNNNTSSNNGYDKIERNDFTNTLLTSLFTTLTEKEQTIIKLLFGIGYEREYEIKEVAEKMNMSSERIRQLKTILVEKMRDYADKLRERL